MATITTLRTAPCSSTAEEPLTNLCSALSLSEDRVIVEGQQTASRFEQFITALQERFTSLSEENRRLREQLVGAESREREITELHQHELAAAQQRIETAQHEVTDVRQQMAAAANAADARVAAALAAQNQAVTAATQAGVSQVAAAQAQISTLNQQMETLRLQHAQQLAAAEVIKNAAVQAATQAGAAQVAAARQEANELRQNLNTATARISFIEGEIRKGASFSREEINKFGGTPYHLPIISALATKKLGRAFGMDNPKFRAFFPGSGTYL